MEGDKEIIKIRPDGKFKLPKFMEISPGETLYFRQAIFEDGKFIIVDEENVNKIINAIDQLYSERKINAKEYADITRYIFSKFYSSECDSNGIIMFPKRVLTVEDRVFECEEVHTKIKKFVLTPIK